MFRKKICNKCRTDLGFFLSPFHEKHITRKGNKFYICHACKIHLLFSMKYYSYIDLVIVQMDSVKSDTENTR